MVKQQFAEYGIQFRDSDSFKQLNIWIIIPTIGQAHKSALPIQFKAEGLTGKSQTVHYHIETNCTDKRRHVPRLLLLRHRCQGAHRT